MRIVKIPSIKERKAIVELENGKHVVMSFEQFVKQSKENEVKHE